MALSFEWDDQKARLNVRKHGVAFEEAMTTFTDPLARLFDDRDHSMDEKREVIVGHSVQGRLLLVCFTEKVSETIRIFSARLATRKERADYETSST